MANEITLNTDADATVVLGMLALAGIAVSSARENGTPIVVDEFLRVARDEKERIDAAVAEATVPTFETPASDANLGPLVVGPLEGVDFASDAAAEYALSQGLVAADFAGREWSGVSGYTKADVQGVLHAKQQQG